MCVRERDGWKEEMDTKIFIINIHLVHSYRIKGNSPSCFIGVLTTDSRSGIDTMVCVCVCVRVCARARACAYVRVCI